MGPGMPWAFLGLFTGVGKLALVASVALLLFGRTDVLRHIAPRALRPWLSTLRPGVSAPFRLGHRNVLALKILGWAALAAWVATRLTRIGRLPSSR